MLSVLVFILFTSSSYFACSVLLVKANLLQSGQNQILLFLIMVVLVACDMPLSKRDCYGSLVGKDNSLSPVTAVQLGVSQGMMRFSHKKEGD
jgi:hypothetical protein